MEEPKNHIQKTNSERSPQIPPVLLPEFPPKVFTQPMTREIMIDEIVTEWGLPEEPRGIDDIVFLNNTPGGCGWSELFAEQEQREVAKRKAWLTNASAEWLPIVQDLIVNPPDFAVLENHYGSTLNDFWPYGQFEEEMWLYQIDGMLEEWRTREPEKVAPIMELTEQKLKAIQNASAKNDTEN